MTINTTLGEYGAQQLEITGKKALLRGLDIWNVEVVLIRESQDHLLISSSQTIRSSEIFLYLVEN